MTDRLKYYFFCWLSAFLFFTLLSVSYHRNNLQVKNKLLRKAIHNRQWEVDMVHGRNAEMDMLGWMRRATELRHPDWALIIKTIYVKSAQYGLRPDLMLAVAHRESNFDPLAQSPVAVGVMQINYYVWAKPLGLDGESIYDIEKNIDAACKIMKMYLDEVGGDEVRALELYNCGYKLSNPGYVPRIQSSKFYRGVQ